MLVPGKPRQYRKFYIAALTALKLGLADKTEGIHMFLIEGIIVKQAAKNTWIRVEEYQWRWFAENNKLKMGGK